MHFYANLHTFIQEINEKNTAGPMESNAQCLFTQFRFRRHTIIT